MATKKRISMKSVFYTAVSLVWIFGLSAIGHIVMVVIERYNPGIKYDFAWACAIATGKIDLFPWSVSRSRCWAQCTPVTAA